MTNKIVTNFFEKIAEKLSSFEQNKKIITEACNIAQTAHQWQFRKYTGNPYINHPLQVALILADKFNDLELVLTGILHDVVEDCDYIKRKEIYSKFGNNVGFIIDAVSKNYNDFYLFPEQKFKDKIEKLLYGGLKDIKCLLLKIADRSHNLQTLQGLKNEKQIRISFETQAIYEPLKQVLKWDKTNNIWELTNDLHTFIQTKKILTASEFKEKLLQETFDNMNNNIFDLIYKNTNRFIWEINDKNFFKKIITINWFDNRIEVLKIELSKNNFCATLKYKKWLLLKKNSDLKLRINENIFQF